MARVKQAIEYLDGLALRPSTACDWLGNLNCRVNAMALFQQYCPRRFRAHAATCLQDDQSLNRALEDFFRELGQRFPLSLYDDEFDPDWNSRYLPVYPEAEEWHEWEAEYIPLPILGAMVLDGDYPPVMRLPGWTPQGSGWQTDKLEALCARQRTPLRWAYLAVQMAHLDTGNDWLDITPEMHDGRGPEMSAAAIDFLTIEWRAARRISAKVARLDAWLKRDVTRLQKLQRLLLSARTNSASLAQVLEGEGDLNLGPDDGEDE